MKTAPHAGLSFCILPPVAAAKRQILQAKKAGSCIFKKLL